MDKRIASVALALILVAGAFLAWPTTDMPVAEVPGAVGETPEGQEAPAEPIPEDPPSEVTVGCRPLYTRLLTYGDEAFADEVGRAAQAKLGTDAAVIAKCAELEQLTDEQIKAWITGNLALAVPGQ